MERTLRKFFALRKTIRNRLREAWVIVTTCVMRCKRFVTVIRRRRAKGNYAQHCLKACRDHQNYFMKWCIFWFLSCECVTHVSVSDRRLHLTHPSSIWVNFSFHITSVFSEDHWHLQTRPCSSSFIIVIRLFALVTVLRWSIPSYIHFFSPQNTQSSARE